MKILIIDDNEKMRKAIKSVIPGEDNIIYEASDGNEGVELYKKVFPDRVVMDIKMKMLNGIEATKQIKLINPQANIIILTNYDTKYYQKASFTAGAKYFLSKENLVELPVYLFNKVYN